MLKNKRTRRAAASRQAGAVKTSGEKSRDARRTEDLTQHEVEDIEERSSPRTPVIYEIVRRHGEDEMARPALSLWWSGVAAGLSISFSLLAQAALQMHLPDAPWRPLVTGFGYSVGFLMAVLGRQQLFTENTLTVVLPVMADPTPSNLIKLVRMWSIVFLANIVGTLVAALFCNFTPVLSAELYDTMLAISRDAMTHGWIEMFLKGIASGFLIAAMVWLIPSADSAQFHVITLMTYLIAIGGFAHIVAGSMEGFLLVVKGQLDIWRMVADFMAPVLLGNVCGGTALFAVLSYAQVMQEI
jgi:formate/nitrite transporter FocA (FNT family)